MGMKYRLGIDLGTSSMGVAAFGLDENNEIKDLIYLDSYIFGEPVVPKTMVTTNTDRRGARLTRRQIERKAKRS
jgi:CRISPR-associated endonuclease Csn1